MTSTETSSRLRSYGIPILVVSTAVLAPKVVKRLKDLLFPKGKPLERQPKLKRPVRVAILGAGVGGCALAQWLRDLYGEDLELTVVNDGHIGGRCQTVRAADGMCYEAGGTIVSELNEYMIGFMRRFGLREQDKAKAPMGIFDGEKFLVRDVDPMAAPLGVKKLAAYQSAWRLINHFGFLNLSALKKLFKHKNIASYPKLYKALGRGDAFKTPEALMDALGPECVNQSQQETFKWLTSPKPDYAGLSETIVNELASAGMRCNYGGNDARSLHAFVGLVSIAGGLASRCFGIHGGILQVMHGLIAGARPQSLLLGTTCRGVRRAKGSKAWEVVVEPDAPGEAMIGAGSPAPRNRSVAKGPFDVVVVAHPLERSCLTLEGLPQKGDEAARSGKFRRCATHYVYGTLKREYFSKTVGLDTSSEGPPMVIFTTPDSTAPFYSVGVQLSFELKNKKEVQAQVDKALRGELVVYKVFAPEVLSDAVLDTFFAKREGKVEVFDWYAYPHYTVPQTFRPFVLDSDDEASLLYLNAVEQTAACYEMSAIAARNMANLVVQYVDKRRNAADGF